MKHTWKQILALCLSLVLVAVLLPVSPAAASELPTEGIVLAEDDFTQYTKISEVTAKEIYTNTSTTIAQDADGVYVLKAGNHKNNRMITISLDVDLPKSYETMTFYLKYEVEVSAIEGKSYLFDFNGCKDSDGTEIASDKKPASAYKDEDDYYHSVSANGTGTTTGGYEKLTTYWKIRGSDIGTLVARLGAHSSGEQTGYVYIKNYKISLLPAVGTYAGADMIAAMAYDDAYAKLTSDVTVDGSLMLGKNAVLDLNGYTLTVSGSVSAGANARVIDSSADKTGKLAVAKDGLLIANPDNPQLPLWAGDGYILTEPTLTDRAIFANESADGFTLDFRPGFGYVGTETVREKYMASVEDCDIIMGATLSWTDIYEETDSVDLTYKDGFFMDMYAKETTRGRLTLTGAEQYQSISLGITLSSCGVTCSFDPLTFTNSFVTKHYAANFNDGEATGFNNTTRATVTDGVLNVTGAVTFSFDNLISTGEGKTLVIEFDLPDPNYANYFCIRYRRTADDDYTGLISVNNSSLRAHHDTYGYFYEVGSFTETDPVTVRMEIDLGSGEYKVTYGGNTYTGKNDYYEEVLNNDEKFYLYCSDYNNRFDNLLVYTIDNGQ